MAEPDRGADPLWVCTDVGSTFTKALLVDGEGAVLARAVRRTTVGTDVMEGYDACLADLAAADPRAGAAERLTCSSAGGGLRVLVVGQEELVTAEAGRRVALSSGGGVVGVLSGLTEAETARAEIARTRPDVVLLTGGTDGGNAAPLLRAARVLGEGGWRGPVVLAGNLAARDEALAALTAYGVPVEPADNVLPRIGVLAPDSARVAIRAVFLCHVIGGKQLSRRPEFVRMVRGATPDVLLRGLELLVDRLGLPVGAAVVDVGGATTDVHSVVRLDAETAALGREVVAAAPVTRPVEGDLGMRWSAESTARAAVAAGLADQGLLAAARRRTADPGLVPADEAERAADLSLAGAAVTLAVRRHVGRSRVVLSPEGRVVERTGVDLREIDLLIGSGGVLRENAPERARAILAGVLGRHPEGWQQPERPVVRVDTRHVLAAVGLLAERAPRAAAGLADTLSQ